MEKSCGIHALRIAVGITMLVLLLAGSAGATTITVNASDSGDYTRIQDAIDNASAGDMILVYSGTYYENVNVTKQLILRGIGNPVVDAGGSGSAITLSANGIMLEGFTATRGSSYPEAGIKVTSSSNMLNGNNASSNNYCGIFLSFSNNNTLNGSNASNNDIGIYLYSSGNNTISGNNASNNSYSGIYLSSSSNNKLSRNNASSNNWNGIYLEYSNNNTLSGNNASSNNNLGIVLFSSSKNTIYNNIFNNTNNFYFYGSNINIWNTTRQPGTNIIGGSLLGGNFWANPNGTGFSQTCKDVNGDGICDSSRTLDANNIDYLPIMKYKIPLKSVSKLKNVSYASAYINWTWKDPKDTDFKKVMVFIDGNFKENVSKGKWYYNATDISANTKHTISTWTVDRNGNINKTWTNSSAWTAK